MRADRGGTIQEAEELLRTKNVRDLRFPEHKIGRREIDIEHMD